MATLLMRLQAPMQSWGVSSHFTVRDTQREPTKSGVIGLICAALGRPRSAPLDDLASLKMGVRVDREGKLLKDYHIAQDVYKASGGKPKGTELSNRYYLSDAAFLVGLEGDEQLLEKIQSALRRPKWPLYLGRRAFPPSRPVWLTDGLQNPGLMEALAGYPLLVSTSADRLRVVFEDDEGPIMRNDVPVSFEERRFVSRNIRISYLDHSGEILEEVADGAV